eukprot:12597500-Alexandrium_andersonii.AAC.1
MSASLVGSEMCIRDRPAGALRPLALCRLPPFRPARQAGGAQAQPRGLRDLDPSGVAGSAQRGCVGPVLEP